MNVFRGSSRICLSLQSNLQFLPRTRCASANAFLHHKPRITINVSSRQTFASKKASKPSKAIKSSYKQAQSAPTSTTPPTGNAAIAPYNSNPYATTLASKPSSTLLYLAPESQAYPLACLGVSSILLAYAAYHFYDAYIVPHPGLPRVVSHMLAGVAVTTGGVGIYILFGMRNLVYSLTAVPAAVKAGVQSNAGLVVRMEKRKLFPVFGRPNALERPLDDVTRGERMGVGREMKVDAVTRREMQAKEEQERAEQRERETFFVTLTKPIVNLFKFLARGIRRLVYREGFMNIYVSGKPYRLDTKGGWMLDEGNALDRLLKIRES